MTVQALQVKVTHGQFLMEGLDAAFQQPQYTGGNGLIWVSPPTADGPEGNTTAAVMTGTFDGTVRLTASIHDRAPAPDTSAWDEAVEVSMTITGPTLHAYPPEFPESAAEIPLPARPGRTHSYRLRVHARGRDQREDPTPGGGTEQPAEEYLILIWPAPPAPESLLKLTDNTGTQIRASGKQH